MSFASAARNRRRRVTRIRNVQLPGPGHSSSSGSRSSSSRPPLPRPAGSGSGRAVRSRSMPRRRCAASRHPGPAWVGSLRRPCRTGIRPCVVAPKAPTMPGGQAASSGSGCLVSGPGRRPFWVSTMALVSRIRPSRPTVNVGVCSSASAGTLDSHWDTAAALTPNSWATMPWTSLAPASGRARPLPCSRG